MEYSKVLHTNDIKKFKAEIKAISPDEIKVKTLKHDNSAWREVVIAIYPPNLPTLLILQKKVKIVIDKY